jgi:hypothetical protein
MKYENEVKDGGKENHNLHGQLEALRRSVGDRGNPVEKKAKIMGQETRFIGKEYPKK